MQTDHQINPKAGTNVPKGGGSVDCLVGLFPTQRTTSDCFSACLSWLIQIPQDDVPDFTDQVDPKSGKFYHNVADFLRPRGLRMMLVEWRNMPAMLGGPVIARGTSPREKAHAVLWDDDGLLHDPHLSRAGLIGEPTHAMLILSSPNAKLSNTCPKGDHE